MAAEGGKADIVKPLQGFSSGVLEVALPYRGDAFRVIYAVQLDDDIWVLHAFQKKSTHGIKTPSYEIDLIHERLKEIEGDARMKSEKIEVVRGGGNVFRDFGRASADVQQLKAILAAEIIKMLDREGLSVRGAHDRTGIAAADFSRIRNADLGRFTLDRLISIINRLGSRVDVKIRLRSAERVESLMA
jgi:phage-related protein/predicted XRE-type DNA-binding protein